MPASAPSKLTWAKDTELVGIQLELESLETCRLYQRYMVGLHAWFLEQVEHLNPELSRYLHDGLSEKPFALSNLEGSLVPIKDEFEIQAGQTYHWSIYALSKPLVQWLADWHTQVPSLLKFRDTSFRIRGIHLSRPSTSYKKLMRSEPLKETIIQLKFLSPTSFRSKGYSLPFPYPRNVFHSYLRRWNHFSEIPYEAEPFLDWIEDNTHVYAYQLTAGKVAVAKQGFLTGFSGTLTFELKRTAQQDPEALHLLHTLLKLAPYCGTGYKTTFGLGRTSVEFLSSLPVLFPSSEQEPNSPTIESPSQLMPTITDSASSIQDIDTLTQKLIARRKRQGGTRSLTAARTEAEILIRYQEGESLKAIAQKMGRSYDAIKKAFARAKQAMPTQNTEESS